MRVTLYYKYKNRKLSCYLSTLFFTSWNGVYCIAKQNVNAYKMCTETINQKYKGCHIDK